MAHFPQSQTPARRDTDEVPGLPDEPALGTMDRIAGLGTAGSFATTIALALALALGFVTAGGNGRTVEIVIIGAGILLAYLAPWSGGRLLAIGTAAAFIALEIVYDRLNHAHYWEEAFFVAAIVGAVLASATAHLTLQTHHERLQAARRRITELSTEIELTDTLTRGPRRLDSLDQEITRSRRHNHHLDLLVVRPDGLPAIQGRFGDHAVSAVLSAVAEAVALNVRSTDVAFRRGEPDVWVILPETPRENGRVVGERIRLAVASRRLELAPGEPVDLTVSVGIASFPNDAMSNEDLVAAATRALVRAAELGGNRTLLHSVPAEAPPGWGVEHDAARA